MKAIIAIVVVAIPMVLSYDEKFDKVDIDKIIADDALFGSYVNCYLDKGPCDMEYAKEYKEFLPEVVATGCAKCTPIQKQHIRKTVKAVTEKRPGDLLAIKTKYDPKGEHEATFAAFLMGSD